MTDTREACLSLEGVHHQFGSLTAISEVNLAIPEGGRHGIIGPNGAGKTTLFNIAAGEIRPTSGRVRFRGRDITALPPFSRAALGIARTFQTTSLFPKLTLRENVSLALHAFRPGRMQMLRTQNSYREIHEEVDQLLDRMSMTDRADVPVASFSHGEQRQVEILMALGQNPSLLLLDEPTAGLSRGDAPLVTGMVKALPKEVTIILIEHDMDIVFDIVDMMTVLHDGRVVASGTVEEVRADPLVQEIYLGGEL